MVKKIKNQYLPDNVTPPGVTLQETIEALGMTQADLADRTGRSKKMINEIIKGKAPITPKMAIELERVLGTPASFWNNRERNYREGVARIEEQERLKKHIAWLDSFPVSNMVKWGWINKYNDKVQQLQELLKYFAIASPDQWPRITSTLNEKVVFRKSTAFKSDNDALLTWLRRGEIEAGSTYCKPFNREDFQTALHEIRRLTVEPPEVFQKKITEICFGCGVAVVFTPELPKTRVSGATRWLSLDKALIQLSLRYKSDDHLWFSFFHEAGHIIKHGKKEIFIEGASLEMVKAKEQEADQFASDFLIPRASYSQFIRDAPFSKSKIEDFASSIGIAPGIVVGRLQHDNQLPVTHCNDLKKRFEWA
jgi:HTH-type transcriptional regulator / antitoxin HigA